MRKPKTPRIVKRNLINSKLAMQELTLGTLGEKLDPPLTASAVCLILKNASPEDRLKEIAAILKTTVPTIFPKKQEIANASNTDDAGPLEQAS